MQKIAVIMNKKPVGRPKSPSTIRLERATVQHVDAVARAVAREIRGLLASHVRRDEAEHRWWHHVETIRQRMAQLVTDAVTVTGASYEGIQRLVDEALAELTPRGSEHASEPPPAPGAPRYPLVAPPIRPPRSTTVASARARLCSLRAQKLDIKAMIGDPK